MAKNLINMCGKEIEEYNEEKVDCECGFNFDFDEDHNPDFGDHLHMSHSTCGEIKFDMQGPWAKAIDKLCAN